MHKSAGASVIEELVEHANKKYVVSCEGCLSKLISASSIFPLPPRVFTMVRHPLDRAISEFNMQHKSKVSSSSKSSKEIELETLHEFSLFARDEGSYQWHVPTSNPRISKRPSSTYKNKYHFFNRFSNTLDSHSLEHMWFVGVTDFYEASLCILLHKMGLPRGARCKCSGGSLGDHKAFVHNDHSVSHRITAASIPASLKMSILNKSLPDMAVYVHGLRLLREEATAIRTLTRTDFLCRDGWRRLDDALHQHSHVLT